MMLEQNDIKQAIQAYRETATQATETAERAVLPEPAVVKFCTSAITPEYAKEMSHSIQTGKRKEDLGSEFVYVFSIADSCEVGSQELIAAFEEGRRMQMREDHPGKKNLCQPNGLPVRSRAIYVGRSYSPRERFKQHLLESAGGTYAIHFQSWSSELHLHVEFFCYQFRGLGNHAAQVLEDGLWDHLQPLLGKRGAK